MLSCMGISGNWRTSVRNLVVRVSRRKLRGMMPTSGHRIKAGFVRKAPAMNRTAEFWMVSRIASKVGEESYGYNRFWDGREFLGC